MSGGVDSSVAAGLLMDQGYEVIGAFMRLGEPPEPAACKLDASASVTVSLPQAPAKKNKQGCCSVNDAHDARSVAAQLGIPLYVLNFRSEFERVIDYFTDEYNAGRTPNPCIRCNDWLKLGSLYDKADALGCDFIATGHHARITVDSQGEHRLTRGVDGPKDQSYVLFGTRRERLARTLLPVGAYTKAQVRAIAEGMDLETFDKPDSQEICFVPGQDYARVVEGRTPGGFERGTMVDPAGRVLAEHEGHQHFTLGQRRGLGVATGSPLYVIDKNAERNTVTVGPREALTSQGCLADDTNWLVEPPPTDTWIDVTVQIRSHGAPHCATLRRLADGRLDVRFNHPVTAVTPGQAIVAYGSADSDTAEMVIAGGWITSDVRE